MSGIQVCRREKALNTANEFHGFNGYYERSVSPHCFWVFGFTLLFYESDDGDSCEFRLVHSF